MSSQPILFTQRCWRKKKNPVAHEKRAGLRRPQTKNLNDHPCVVWTRSRSCGSLMWNIKRRGITGRLCHHVWSLNALMDWIWSSNVCWNLKYIIIWQQLRCSFLLFVLVADSRHIFFSSWYSFTFREWKSKVVVKTTLHKTVRNPGKLLGIYI